jgi:PAS domain S-box-containing protein
MGYSKEDIKSGLNAFNFFISEDRATLQKNLERRLQGEITGGTKYTAVRKNGSTFPVIVYSVPIVTENRIIGLQKTNRMTKRHPNYKQCFLRTQ